MVSREPQKMVSREGLEPSTPGLKGPCSNLLSYRPILRWWTIEESHRRSDFYRYFTFSM